MYFAKNLSTFVVGALLATSALGNTFQVPRRAAENVVAREEAKAIRGHDNFKLARTNPRLLAVNFSSASYDPAFGAGADNQSIRAKAINLIASVRTLMRSTCSSFFPLHQPALLAHWVCFSIPHETAVESRREAKNGKASREQTR
ncbi:hypothetical protein NUW58_g2674 [Xylaria curta]|uniref:Uncharacterized protein n=1 Tax=Xylaria curta TaxID=42375 RepID=A0ACC1PGT7_9PEZI|nr:hypothetical protein NUW58_g2674 [Xylaria curta]